MTSPAWEKVRRAGIFRVLLNPLTSLIANPISLIRSLYSCRVLFEGRWPDYLSVSGSGSLLRFFYMTQASNLRRHGLRGTSDTMGGGTLNMQTFWYQSVIGVTTFQALGGVVVALIGMLTWLVTHLVWLDGSVNAGWVVLVLLMVAVTNNFYGNLFAAQNYAALGWGLMPVAVWALLNHHVWLAALIWTGISFLSITVFVAAGLMSFCLAVAHHEPLQLLGVLPGVAKFALDLYYTHRSAKGTTIRRSLRDMLGYIGGRRDVKYKRPIRVVNVFVFAAVLSLFPLAV